MRKYLIPIFATIFLAGTVLAAPDYIWQRSILPQADSTYTLGTTTYKWLSIFTNTLCLSGDCQSSWPTGGTGSKFVTTSINFLSSTQFTFTGAGGISIATSPPGTVAFTMTETDPIFSSYPAIATNTFVSKNSPSTTAWNTAYFNASTSRENPLTFSSGLQRTGDSVVNSGVTSLNSQTGAVTLNLEFLSATNTNVTGTVAQFNFTNATGTRLVLDTGLFTSSTLTYLNFQNATGTRILANLFNFTSGTTQFINVQNVTGTLANFSTSSLTQANIGTASIGTLNLINALPSSSISGLGNIAAQNTNAVVVTSLTSTNFFSSIASATTFTANSGTIRLLNSTNVTTTGLVFTNGSGVTSTITYLNFLNATGTSLNVTSATIQTSTITYLNTLNVTSTGRITVSGTFADYFGRGGTLGQVLVVTTTGGVQWMSTSSLGIVGGSGATTFLQLTDTPSSYSGQAGLCTKVNATETGIEFALCASGGGGGGVNTSTSGLIAYYNSPTSVTGTPGLAFNISTGITATVTTTLATTTVNGSFIAGYGDWNAQTLSGSLHGWLMQSSSFIFFGGSSTQNSYLASANGKIFSRSDNIDLNTANGRSNYNLALDEPTNMQVTTVANTQAILSDDPSKIAITGTAVNGTFILKNNTLSPIATGATAKYSSANTLQTLTANTLGGTNSAFRGAVVWKGYIYLMVSSTYGDFGQIVRATSSANISVNSGSSWVTSTESGTPITKANLGLIGAARINGRDYLYVATSTTQIVPYLITTSTNTLTAQTPITCSGTTIALNSSRVNNNGIYAAYNAAPFVRKHDFSCTAVANTENHYSSAPATTGPDLFAFAYSIGGLQGTNWIKFYGW